MISAEKNRTYRRKYAKTPKGLLVRVYHNMHSRIAGISWHKAHLYLGKELLSKQEFYDWAQKSKQFWVLYHDWVVNDYIQRLIPTVNRIDSSSGYLTINMEWITHGDNSRLGAISRWEKIKRNN